MIDHDELQAKKIALLVRLSRDVDILEILQRDINEISSESDILHRDHNCDCDAPSNLSDKEYNGIDNIACKLNDIIRSEAYRDLCMILKKYDR